MTLQQRWLCATALAERRLTAMTKRRLKQEWGEREVKSEIPTYDGGQNPMVIWLVVWNMNFTLPYIGSNNPN